jgi:DNA repair protein RadC
MEAESEVPAGRMRPAGPKRGRGPTGLGQERFVNAGSASGPPIRDWAASDRPREKLLRHGSAVLSDAELLALLLGSGAATHFGTHSAVALGRSLIANWCSLYELSATDVRQLMHVQGIGPAKAARLDAAFEIGRRIESFRGPDKIRIEAPADLAAIYGPFMRALPREVFRVVLLNTSNFIIKDEIISEGGLAASIVEPRSVFRTAVLENAAAIVCLHNHPSGNLEPSREDIIVTQQLVEGGRIMGIPVCDHIIIAGRGYTSLAERGLIRH